MTIQIWHNAVCSTSNKAKEALFQAFGDRLEIRDYIKNSPSTEEIKDVLHKMDQKAIDILRKKDKVYKEQFDGKELTEEEWINAMSAHPSIIERPIIITDAKAYLARPIDDFIDTVLPTLL